MTDRRLDGEQGVGIIRDHPFIPDGEWWRLCVECHLSEAAHERTTLYDAYVDRRRDDRPNSHPQ